MRIRIEFGSDAAEVVPWYKTIPDFPKLLRYQGNVWEFVLYQEDTTYQTDYIFNFSRIVNYPGKYYEIPSFTDMFLNPLDNDCECGAKYDRDNPMHHMFMCRKWKPKA
jgi:hypothetical protein